MSDQPPKQPQPGQHGQSRFKKATREKLKLRAAFDGPSGSGKTVTAIRCAQAMIAYYQLPTDRPAGRIAFIDTESGRGRKYINQDFGEGPVDFDVIELTSFSPSEYTAAIEEAGRDGYFATIVDSLSHAWEGKDGALEQKDRKGGNSYTAWKDITPMHRRMIDAIITSPCHVFCTMRSKTEYILELDSKGKQVPKKVGMAPIQRQGMEYEFDVYGSLDLSHMLTITKTMCPSLDGLIVSKPGTAFIVPVIKWLETGERPATVAVRAKLDDQQRAHIAALVSQLGWNMERVRKMLPSRFQCTEVEQLGSDQAAALISHLEGHAKSAAPPPAAPAPATQTPAPPSNGTVQAPAPPATPPADLLSQAQLDRLAELKTLLQANGWMQPIEWRDGYLKQLHVETARALTKAKADSLIRMLEQRERDARLAATPQQNETLQQALAAQPEQPKGGEPASVEIVGEAKR